MKTSLTELLGIQYPIIQGAMAWTSEHTLAAAVANAGATGVIATGGRDTEWVRQEIRQCKIRWCQNSRRNGESEPRIK